jgi:hypothetical protein
LADETGNWSCQLDKRAESITFVSTAHFPLSLDAKFYDKNWDLWATSNYGNWAIG